LALTMKKLAVFLMIIVWLTGSHISVASAWFNSWALIEDFHGNQLWIEVWSDEAWDALAQLNGNGSMRWIGGVVEAYDNEWGFRFAPDTVRVSDGWVAESWPIPSLGSFLGKFAWTWAGVVEARGSPDVNRDLVINVVDLTIVSLAYGSFDGDPDYNPVADITEDGFVDMRDLSRVARYLGEFADFVP